MYDFSVVLFFLHFPCHIQVLLFFIKKSPEILNQKRRKKTKIQMNKRNREKKTRVTSIGTQANGERYDLESDNDRIIKAFTVSTAQLNYIVFSVSAKRLSLHSFNVFICSLIFGFCLGLQMEIQFRFQKNQSTFDNSIGGY